MIRRFLGLAGDHVNEHRTQIGTDTVGAVESVFSHPLNSGAVDALDLDIHFQELSQSRAGYGVDIDVADDLVERLASAGLVEPTKEGVSLPMQVCRTRRWVVSSGGSEAGSPSLGRE